MLKNFTRNYSMHKTAENSDKGVLPLFVSLLRCAIGNAAELPSAPTPQQWEQLYALACKQALQGIAFPGIERLPQHQRPHSALILKWYRTVLAIKAKNNELTKNAILVSERFLSEGFPNCVLKGQGVAQYYPDPSLRVAGDIDLWLQGGCSRVLAYVKRFVPDCYPTYHHVDFPVLKGVDIELHYRPSWMYSPLHNARLQEYFAFRERYEFSRTVSTSQGELHAPSTAFNLVYLPIHIYRHLFDEGIGLRQILDYYYVLTNSVAEDRHECVALLRSIGMARFMRALMYVLKQMFDVPEEYMVFPPAEKDGRFLLNEIIEAGNFGKSDSRYAQSRRGFNMQHFKNQFKRSAAFFCYYPSEVIWNPFFKLWHSLWRKRAR